MTREQAAAAFLRLVGHYGLGWRTGVPAEAYAEMAEVHAVLSANELRTLLLENPQ
jgi:hypothetical protein